MRDPYVLVVPAAWPLAAARRAPATLEDASPHPLILLESCRARPLIEEHMRANGAEPAVAFCSDDNGTVQGLVAAGLGVAVVPRLTMDENDPRTVLRPLATPVPPRILGIVRHRDRLPSRAVEAFVATARATLPAPGEPALAEAG
jgi:LysR family transcriptional activator of glutamate synthase operon